MYQVWEIYKVFQLERKKRNEEIIVARKKSDKSGNKASKEAEGYSIQSFEIYRQEKWVGG